MKTFYITTPIYYVNGAPHIGHAYTSIVADVMARFYRAAGDDVFFLTGTDEHGLKIQRAAEDRNITPIEMADENSNKFRTLFADTLNLSHDRFIRTTEPEHRKVVDEILTRMKASGDIYLGSYAGWYAAADEAFYSEDEVEDGKSTVTGAPVEWVEESSYFFKLSKYEKPLLEWYAENRRNVSPDFARKEVTSFVSGGLKDLSISRTTFDWGIPFIDDPEHVLYVWVDALTNYLTGIHAFQDDGMFDKYWPCDCHLIGKDILRFHAVYWPAFLMSADIARPNQVFAHGWWTNEGKKMSKTDGNFIDAFELADEFPDDVLRYYLCRELPLGGDGDFVRKRVAERNNSELADNFGNLVNRALAMTKKYFDGQVPDGRDSDEPIDVALREKSKAAVTEIREFFDKRETHKALAAVMAFSSELNNYIQETQPWKLAKSDEKERLAQSIYHVLEGIRWVSLLLGPFCPTATEQVLNALGVSDRTLPAVWGELETRKLGECDVLFTKIDLEQFDEEAVVEEVKVEPPKEEKNYITFDDFMSVEVFVGQIKEAQKVEGADKLLLLQVDVGEPELRQVVAGIAKSYAPDDILEKRVAVVMNLKPRKIFKIESRGMLLAADTTDGGLELTFYSEHVPVGSRIG